MELICVRHGRTAWNAGRRFQGQTDVPLDAEGLAQAAAIAEHLRGESFDIAVSSDLSRAVATARAILAGRELPLQLDTGLREMQFGAWEGLTWDEIVARWPEINNETGASPRNYTPEGGESWPALGGRVRDALHRITADLAPDGRALIVSHAGIMHAIVGIVMGPENEATLGVKFLPASILRVRGSFAGGWELAAVNETADSAPTHAG